MIQAKFELRELRMQMEGHAGGREPGQEYDLICCAASTISQAMIYNIEEWAEEHGHPLDIELETEKGLIRLHVKAPEWARLTVMKMMQYGMRGMEMLEEKYRKYIRVTEE